MDHGKSIFNKVNTGFTYEIRFLFLFSGLSDSDFSFKFQNKVYIGRYKRRLNTLRNSI